MVINVSYYLDDDTTRAKLVKDIDKKDYTLILSAKDMEQLDNIKSKVIDRLKQEHQTNNIKVNFIEI